MLQRALNRYLSVIHAETPARVNATGLS
jgi:hypothetical protein